MAVRNITGRMIDAATDITVNDGTFNSLTTSSGNVDTNIGNVNTDLTTISNYFTTNGTQLNYEKLPSGTAIQTVQASSNAYTSVAGTSYVWLTATITRKLPSSKVLCLFSGTYGTSSTVDTAVRLWNAPSGGSSVFLSFGADTSRFYSSYSIGTDKGGLSNTSGSSVYFMIPANIKFLHSPNSTLTQEYRIYIYAETSTTIYPNGDGWRGGGQQSHSTQANLILMEIK